MFDASEEWGLPDWQDASGYVARADWNANRWRWEFIRRRQDIRDTFDRWAWHAYEENLASFAERPEGFPEGRVRSPSERGFYFHTKSLMNGELTPHPLPNPRIGDQPYFAIAWTDNTRGLALERPDGARGQDYFQAAFDLRRPLGPQLEMAKEWALSIQAERQGKKFQIRQHPEKWPCYLRVLDARASGASWSVVANILPKAVAPTVNTARSVHKQAEALCFKSWI